MARKTFRIARAALLGGTLLCGVASPAFGQDAGAMPASGDDASNEVVVTAQRRAERLIETPQSVTSLSGDQLARLGATQFTDFANTVPGLQFTTQGAGSAQISMRGVTTGADIGPTVGIYVDEVPYGSSSAFANGVRRALDVGLFNIERIEVLRGPQGTLYGASSMGGVLKYVTRTPSLTAFSGSARLSIADTHNGAMSYVAAGTLNAPLVQDQVALQASGYYSRVGGYTDNVTTGARNVDTGDIYGGRFDLLAQATDTLSVRLTGFAQNISRGGGAYADIALDGTPLAGPLDQVHPLAEPFRSRFRLVSGTVENDFGGVTLTSVTSYQTARTFAATDGSAVYAPLLQLFFGIPAQAVAINEVARTRKFTEELRLASSDPGRVEWVIGGFYTHETSLLQQIGDTFGAGGAAIPVNIVTARIHSRYEEYAIFGDLTFHVSDRFDLSAGLRYARNNQAFEQDASGLLVTSGPLRTSDEDVVTWLANARYRFSPHVIAYARFATGYRPGGPNFLVLDPVTGLPAAPDTYKSDTLASYELGFRAETPDRSFGIDLSAFFIDWKDIQLLTAVSGVTTYLNAGGAHIKGLELAVSARPSRDFNLTGTLSYNDGHVTDASAALGAAAGERLPNTAHLTAALSADYRLSASLLHPSLGATFRYVSSRTASFDANASLPQYRLPAYTSLDLRVGLTAGPIDVQLYVRNLFDTRGQLSAQTVLSAFGGPAQVTILQPRTVGVELSTRF
jgi:outer membrane receptor protein involved in Fe transport